MKAKIFIINLESTREELFRIDLEFEAIKAVNGSQLSDEEIKQNYSSELNSQRYLKPLTKGEIGCYMSHRIAWQKIIDKDLDYAIILEDDCEFYKPFSHIHQALEKLKNWDYIKLTGPREKKVADSISIETEKQKFDLVHYDRVPTSCLGQAISRRGAQKLLAKSLPFSRPVDADIQCYWELDIDVLGLEPKMMDLKGFQSDIKLMDTNNQRKARSSTIKRLRFRGYASIMRLIKNKYRPSLRSYLK